MSGSARLGDGASANVWKFESDAKQRVVIKFFHRNNPLALQHRETEIKMYALLKKLEHPHILKSYGVSPDHSCIVLEFATLGSLKDVVESRAETQTHFTPFEIRAISIQITKALVALHACCIVHRDLALRNILVTEVGNKIALLIADCGVARLLKRRNQKLQTAKIFSPHDSAYEDCTARANDKHAVGVMIFECMTLTVLEDPIDETVMIHNLQTNTELIRLYPKELRELVCSLLRRVPPTAVSFTNSAMHLKFKGEIEQLCGSHVHVQLKIVYQSNSFLR